SNDAAQGVRYVLHVPNDGPALLSASESDVEQARQKILSRTGATAAMRKLDDYATALRQAFGDDSGIVGEFADAMHDVETSWLTESGDPRGDVEKRIGKFESALTEKDPKETLFLLSVVHGNALTPEQIEQARSILHLQIADGYAASTAPPQFDLSALLFCLNG